MHSAAVELLYFKYKKKKKKLLFCTEALNFILNFIFLNCI